MFSYQVEYLKAAILWTSHLGMRVPWSWWLHFTRHPGSRNFKALLLAQLLDHLLSMGGRCGFTTGSHPCRRNSNEMLKHLSNLMGKQLKGIEEIPSAVATSLDGRTIAGTYICISSSEICENLLVSGRAGSSPKSTSSLEVLLGR